MKYKAVIEMEGHTTAKYYYGMYGYYCGPVSTVTGSTIIDSDNTNISIVKPFSESTDEDICKYIASHIDGDIDLTDIFKLYDRRIIGGGSVSTLEKFECCDNVKECTLEYTITHNNSNHYQDTVKIHVSPTMDIKDLGDSSTRVLDWINQVINHTIKDVPLGEEISYLDYHGLVELVERCMDIMFPKELLEEALISIQNSLGEHWLRPYIRDKIVESGRQLNVRFYSDDDPNQSD